MIVPKLVSYSLIHQMLKCRVGRACAVEMHVEQCFWTSACVKTPLYLPEQRLQCGTQYFCKFPFADCIFTFSLTLRLLGSWGGFNLNILFVIGSPYLCSNCPAIPGFKWSPCLEFPTVGIIMSGTLHPAVLITFSDIIGYRLPRIPAVLGLFYMLINAQMVGKECVVCLPEDLISTSDLATSRFVWLVSNQPSKWVFFKMEKPKFLNQAWWSMPVSPGDEVQSWLHKELQASLGSMGPCLRKVNRASDTSQQVKTCCLAQWSEFSSRDLYGRRKLTLKSCSLTPPPTHTHIL